MIDHKTKKIKHVHLLPRPREVGGVDDDDADDDDDDDDDGDDDHDD